jgi:hypothetical protein
VIVHDESLLAKAVKVYEIADAGMAKFIAVMVVGVTVATEQLLTKVMVKVLVTYWRVATVAFKLIV